MTVRVVPLGRLVVQSPDGALQLVNTNGSNNCVALNAHAGTSPRFSSGTRQFITLNGADSKSFTVVDTTGTPRRDVDTSVSLNSVLMTERLGDSLTR